MKGLIIENGDLVVKNGHLVIGDCRLDIVERLAIANRGEFKTSPKSGCGLVNVLGGNTSSVNAFKVNLIEDLKRNNIEYDSIALGEDGFKIKLKD